MEWYYWAVPLGTYLFGVIIGACVASETYSLRLRYPTVQEQWAYGFLWPVAGVRGIYEVLSVFSTVFKKIWTNG